MKYQLSLFLTILISATLSAQTPPTVYTIRADSTLLTGCDSNELIVENHTQAVPGFLWNTGRGRTIFKRPLTKISDTFYLVGQDTLKMRYPNAWLQGGNTFGTAGFLGTLDNNPLDLYTNNTFAARFDPSGNFLLGTNTSSIFKFDMVGAARVTGFELRVTANDAYDARLGSQWSVLESGAASTGLVLGAIEGKMVLNKSASGTIPANSIIIGGAQSGSWTMLGDLHDNPVFVVGSNSATINGGYTNIYNGGSTSANTPPDGNAFPFYINGARGTGAGNTGDIVFQTGAAQPSGITIHPMVGRWVIKGNTGYFSNTGTPTSMIDVTGANGYSQLGLRTSYTPSSTSDTNGNVGDFSWDDNYFYIKTSGGWKRSALSTF
jgi:hypothetical protein